MLKSTLGPILCTSFLSVFFLNGEENPKGLPKGYLKVGEDRRKAIEELCEATSDTGLFSGAVLVADEGEIIYKGAFGLANREWNIANTTDTKFRLASVSKQFCALIILQLVQEQKISLDDTISDHLSYYREDTGSRITIHHLLSHQSGIRDYTSSFDYRNTTSRLSFKPDEFIQLHCSGDPIHEPGTIYSYSNAGYSILGRIIEKTTRKSFEQNLQERIFTPLRMKNSGYDRNRTILEKRASGYTRGVFEMRNADYLDMDSSPGAAGALYSTVEDLFLWDRALYTDQLLEKKYRDLMFTPNRDVPEVKAAGGRAHSRYGYGWQIFSVTHPVTEKRTKLVNHGGAISGFRAMEHRLIDEDAFVIILCNQGDGVGRSDVWNSVLRLGRELIHIVTDQPYRLPGPPPVSQEQRLYQLTLDGGVEGALTWFKKNGKAASWGGTTLSVSERLIREGRVADGLQLMRFEMEQSPQKVWILRKTAQAHLNHGDPEAALRISREALKLKPKDESLEAIQTEAERDLIRMKESK